ncbi:MAG: nicotinate-nucleotide diphosphorylase (carboxylating), partial [Desulfamplus sp.]|nr:nicotinate-nucleotide diphosphorylase (carboxylating) [Desulfamplus sp.]
MVSNNFNIDTKIIKLLEMAFWEDLGDLGDITSDAIFNDNKTDTYWLVAKQEGVICGVDIFACAFNYIDKECIVNFYVSDGDNLKTGQKVAKIEGSINTILKAERVALNFISHLSGIATEVRRWID